MVDGVDLVALLGVMAEYQGANHFDHVEDTTNFREDIVETVELTSLNGLSHIHSVILLIYRVFIFRIIF